MRGQTSSRRFGKFGHNADASPPFGANAVNYETIYSEPAVSNGPTYGLGFNWGSFIGGIGGALNQALNQYPGGQYGQIPQTQQPTQQQFHRLYCGARTRHYYGGPTLRVCLRSE